MKENPPDTSAPPGWSALLEGYPWFSGKGKFPLPAYSEFMPPPRLGRKPYGEPELRPFSDEDPFGWAVTEVEEEYELGPGLEHLAGEIVGALRRLGGGQPEFRIPGYRRRNLADNPYCPPELQAAFGHLPRERYVVLLPLALSRTQDDKGRVRWTFFGSSEQGPEQAFWRGFPPDTGARASGGRPPRLSRPPPRRRLRRARRRARIAPLPRPPHPAVGARPALPLLARALAPAVDGAARRRRRGAARRRPLPPDLPALRPPAGRGQATVLRRGPRPPALPREPRFLGREGLHPPPGEAAPGHAGPAAAAGRPARRPRRPPRPPVGLAPRGGRGPAPARHSRGSPPQHLQADEPLEPRPAPGGRRGPEPLRGQGRPRPLQHGLRRDRALRQAPGPELPALDRGLAPPPRRPERHVRGDLSRLRGRARWRALPLPLRVPRHARRAARGLLAPAARSLLVGGAVGGRGRSRRAARLPRRLPRGRARPGPARAAPAPPAPAPGPSRRPPGLRAPPRALRPADAAQYPRPSRRGRARGRPAPDAGLRPAPAAPGRG